MTEESLTRYRIQFVKGESLRFIGHLDLHRSMERCLRRSNLPLDYSKGFNPRVRLNLSSALPLGCTSVAELADIWLLSQLDPTAIFQALCSATPPGLSFVSVEKIDLKTPSLQSQINGVEYRVEIEETNALPSLSEAVESLLETDELPRVRRGKRYDLRPLVHELEIWQDPPDHCSLRMVLNVGEGATGRPEEVLLSLDLDPTDMLIERTQLFLE